MIFAIVQISQFVGVFYVIVMFCITTTYWYFYTKQTEVYPMHQYNFVPLTQGSLTV